MRVAVAVSGAVQGVGFRPFVHALARRHAVAGWVRNDGGVVRLEVEGAADAVDAFMRAIASELPPPGRVEDVVTTESQPRGDVAFVIVPSVDTGDVRPALPPDVATCSACLAEVADPASRRHRYPFTSCARCGPRLTIALDLPYDRARTTMRGFALCADCRAEYEDPADRRFHAQPLACPACGPTLRFERVGEPTSESVVSGDAALVAAIRALREGAIVALRGLGGYQLLVDATDDAAVQRLRARKHRPDRPLAVLFPSVEQLLEHARPSREELAALEGPEAPIVLVASGPSLLAPSVAPRVPHLGAMLPASALHGLLASGALRPLVCTSGNPTSEPMCIDVDEARIRLGGVADAFVHHDRPIARSVDDSVVSVREGSRSVSVLRRARGFAPTPIRIARSSPTVLAVGAQLKSTACLVVDGEAVLSQHVGDLASVASALLLERTVDDLLRFHRRSPDVIACDAHPDYASTELAERLARAHGVPLVRVQHHRAHVASCLAEHGIDDDVVGFAWDGLGLGDDGTPWGGEAFCGPLGALRRTVTLRAFPLIGGDRASREPRRSAVGLLLAAGLPLDPHLATPEEARVFTSMVARSVQSSPTSSIGRLFDAVAALLGVRTTCTFEGQAAMELEALAGDVDAPPYPIAVTDGVADWEPMLRALLADRAADAPPARIAARFHETLAELAERIAVASGRPFAVLSGGCFQNRRLAASVQRRLETRGLRVLHHERVPTNDGGIALGQAALALRTLSA